MCATNRRTWQCSSALALSVFAFLAAGGAAAGDRWDYWDPRASIPYPPPRPVVVHHVHNGGCGHTGYDRGHGHRHGHGRKYVRGHGRPRGYGGYAHRDD